MSQKKQLIILTCPTAVGKTQLSLKLADRIANLQQTIFLHDKKWSGHYKQYYRDESILINQTLGKASPYLSQKLSILINIYNRI